MGKAKAALMAQSMDDMGPLSGTYLHVARCDNCGSPNHLHIPKGTRIDEYVRNKMCAMCGCRIRRGTLS
jgi:hypothetical protein